MKRINVLELLVLVVFSGFSVATPPPMFSGCFPSSSSVAEHQYLSTYGLNFLLRGLPTRTWSYFNSSIRILRYDDLTKFEYTLITANRVEIFANTGRNTHILFQFGNKLKIYAKDNESITYSLSFEIDSHANFIANYIVSTKSARYKKCNGSDSYQLQKLYERATTGSLYELGENWCIFKIRKTNVTTFMIRWMGGIEEHRKAVCIFRKDDYSLDTLPNANNKLELSISWDDEILEPKYVLETSTPLKLQEFFHSV